MGITRAWVAGALSDMIATGKLLDPVTTKVGVAIAVADHGLDTQLTDITPGPGGMATLVEVTTWTAPYQLLDGSMVVDGPSMEFRPASSAEACTIVAIYVVQTGTPNVLLEVIPVVPAIVLPDNLHAMGCVLRAVFDATGQTDASQIWNG